MSYRHQLAIQYLADFPGARVEQDRVGVTLERTETTLPVKLVTDATTAEETQDGVTLEGAETTLPVEIVKDRTTDRSSPSDAVESEQFVEAGYPSPLGQVYAVHLDVTATGPAALHGVVESTGTYDVWVLEGQRLHTEPLIVEEVASGAAGGTTTTLERTAHGDSLGVVVVDASGNPGNQEMAGTIHVT